MTSRPAPKPSAFGNHRPEKRALPFLWIVRLGLARGELSRGLRKLWTRWFDHVVDIEARGIRYRLNIGDNVTDAKILLSSKQYDQTELQHLAHACSGGTFVDIGANTGYYSLQVAASGARQILAIEPNPPTFERLAFNINCNPFAKTVRALKLAIGPKGRVALHKTTTLGSASLMKRDLHEAGATEVESSPLLDVLKAEDITQIDGLKIDIEGYEYQALEPFFRDAPRSLYPHCMVVEKCHGHVWEQDVIKLLQPHGYTLTAQTRSNAILHRD
ncbi:FkbM family methyltransferase [Thioalkalivibrio sp. ALJ16]|uniref:FkbM family methyltransferase n=1 Tax=Thioalkalivibrio sp. ALJ16 TaxID=1158762 RepID=UPI00036F8C8F|nr:FkbM family methyltransferase [Thioalkalivibrio sp. ALJ16]